MDLKFCDLPLVHPLSYSRRQALQTRIAPQVTAPVILLILSRITFWCRKILSHSTFRCGPLQVGIAGCPNQEARRS
jgi:NADH:ubiquinone oxidoreductase subunit H